LRAQAINEPEKTSTSLPYIPIQKFFDPASLARGHPTLNMNLVRRIPSGTIMNIVNEGLHLATINSDMVVTHQGFLIWKNDEHGQQQLYLRSAAHSAGKVSDIPFTQYFSKYLDKKRYPTVQGLNLLEVTGLN
jgi:hypothetical protein